MATIQDLQDVLQELIFNNPTEEELDEIGHNLCTSLVYIACQETENTQGYLLYTFKKISDMCKHSEIKLSDIKSITLN